MGGIGHQLRVAGEGDVGALRDRVWTFTEARVQDGVGPGAFDDDLWAMASSVFSGQGPGSDHRTEPWSELPAVDGARSFALDYVYWDFAGLMTRAMYAWHHWTALVWSAHWDGLDRLVRAFGFRLLDPRPSLEALLAAPFPRFVQRAHEPRDDEPGKEILLVFEGDPPRLLGAGDREVTGAEAAAAQALGRCLCPLCVQLRRDPALYDSWWETLRRHDRGEPIDGADKPWRDALGLAPFVHRAELDTALEDTFQWWLNNADEDARPRLLLDLVRAGAYGEGPVTRLAYELARGLDVGALLEPGAASLSAEQAYVAGRLLDEAVAAGAPPRDDLIVTIWRAELRGSEYATVVLNVLDALARAPGLPAQPEVFDDVAGVLGRTLESRDTVDEVRAGLLQTLVDMLERVQPTGPALRERLDALSGNSGEVGELARAALARLRGDR